MSLCGCGKPATHMGMCSERWKKRKANNGPAGIRPKDAPVAVDPVRQTYGDLADDVVLLRNRGHLVARFKGQIRVDSDVLTDDQVRAKARMLRMPAAKPVTSAIPTDLNARVAQLERQVTHLFAVVAEAIKGRRETLVEQAKGLAELETTLRTPA